MQSFEEILAKLYRNLEKWLRRVDAVIDDRVREPTKATLQDIDLIIKIQGNDIPELKKKYELTNAVAFSPLIATVRDDDIARKATAGHSSSDELSINTLAIAIVDNLTQLQRYDIVSLIRNDLKKHDNVAIELYLNTLHNENITTFEAVLLGYVKKPSLRGDIEKAKDNAIEAHVVSFDGDCLLLNAQRISAYSSEKDIAALIAAPIGGSSRRAAVRFEDIAPCIVVSRIVGSQHYFNTESLLASQIDPESGLTKKFVADHSTVIDLPMTAPTSASVRVYGDKSSPRFKIIDTIDGINFAQLSLRGVIDVPREDIAILLGERVSREVAYANAMEPIIMERSHNVRAKALLHEYSTKSTDTGTTMHAQDLLRDHYRNALKGITNRASYLRVLTDRIAIMKALKRLMPANLSLHSTFVFERKISQFVKKFEKNIYSSAPSDKEIDAVVNAQTLFEAAFEAALNNTMKNADKNKIFARPEMSLVEFAKINSY